MQKNSFKKHFFPYYLPAVIAVLITIGMVLFPKEAFQAALNGLSIWWNIVFPALLPFFIFSQVLIGLGAVHFLGVLLEPVMRPVFNVPGTGSFVMAMGLASGFPLGAVLTTKLRIDKLCSKIEAERLISFVNTADPLFMFGAVAVGMLHKPQTGMVIAVAHYLSSVSVGLVMRFYKAGETRGIKEKRIKKDILNQALQALVKARQKDGRPIGKLLGNTVRDSVNTLMLIGGFIILFSVMITMLNLSGLTGYLALAFSYLLSAVGMDPALAPAFISGLFEVDLGCQQASTIPNIAMDQRIIALGAIIAWSGLSVHAQVASIISSTDINITPYIFARVIHAVLAGLFSMLLLGPLKFPLITEQALPVFLGTIPSGNIPYWFQRTIFMGGRFFLVLTCLLIISLTIYCFERYTLKKTVEHQRRSRRY
ncbi:MAG: sporulation integral membrane protein YlbJ [Bacillota bacterium]|nr:sporulation integral membrane protein YlbJ [Bacillota bacterium]